VNQRFTAFFVQNRQLQDSLLLGCHSSGSTTGCNPPASFSEDSLVRLPAYDNHSTIVLRHDSIADALYYPGRDKKTGEKGIPNASSTLKYGNHTPCLTSSCPTAGK
jgi:hypothetical protein